MAEDITLLHPGVVALARTINPATCDACLGRCFARVEPGQENAQRGATLRAAAALATAAMECPVCEGVSERVGRYAELALAAAQELEFESFLVGTKTFAEIRSQEETLMAAMLRDDDGKIAELLPQPTDGAPPWPAGEWLRNELNRSVGKVLEGRWPGRRVDFGRPDVVFTIDTRIDRVAAEPNPIWLVGRYRKLSRELPQTRWPCRTCQGMGCRQCKNTGRRYQSSVQDMVAAPARLAFGATRDAFHGMGREDVDAKMLGTGRPFVLELKEPRRRGGVDLVGLAGQVATDSGGLVEVLELRMGTHEDPARYKEANPAKTYRATCRTTAPVDAQKLQDVVRTLSGALLEQRTPQRVAHRRADKVRRRQVRDLSLLGHEGDRFELDIQAEAGTYIKEFVSGDAGRTQPSVAGQLALDCVVEALDVVEISWKD